MMIVSFNSKRVCGQAANKVTSKVYGFVTNAIDDKPVPYATVKVLVAKDSSLVKGTIADSTGFFEFNNIKIGSYILSFTSVSISSLFSREFVIDSISNLIDFGRIKLNEKVATLNDVIVTANKALPLLEYKGDKLIVHLENSFLAPGNTIMEVLPNLPNVTSKNNKLLLNGKAVLILIDGKGEFNARGIQEVISTLPADQVEAIEITRNPSSKYEASTQGIINIKLKRNRNYSQTRAGFQNQLFPANGVSGTGYGRISPGVTINHAIGNLSSSTSVDFVTRSTLEIYNEKFNYSQAQHAINDTEHIEKENFISYRSDIQYNFSQKTTHVIGITLGGFYAFIHRGYYNSNIQYRSFGSLQNDSVLMNLSRSSSPNSVYNNLTFYYTRKFAEDKQQIDLVVDM